MSLSSFFFFLFFVNGDAYQHPLTWVWDKDGEGLYNWDGNGLGVPYPKLALLPSLRAPLLGQWVIIAKICTLMACV